MAEPSFIEQSKLRIREGQVVYRRGEMAQEMFVVLTGRVRLYLGEEPGGDWTEELSKGDFFGEGSLLEGLPRQHTAVTMEDCELIAINRGTFLRMIRQNPEVSVKMMQRLVQRHRELGARLEALEGQRAGQGEAGPAASLVSVLSGRPFPILAHGSLVGRYDPTTGVHPDIDLTAEDHNLSVSRRHARILCEQGLYFLLEEPGVANGTFVRGERLQPGEPRELKHGDRVGFGMVVLFFERT